MRNARSPVPALERGLAVLRALTRAHGGTSALELERALTIPRSSLYRILRILMNTGFVTQDRGDGRFYLSAESMALSFSARTDYPLAQKVRPVLRDLARATGEMSEFAVAAGRWRLMMLETWQTGNTPLNVLSRPGMFMPLNPYNAYGACFLTFDGKRRRDEYLARENVKPPEHFDELCARWRKMGYALSLRNRKNVQRIGVPVFDPRSSYRLLGALGIVCTESALTRIRTAEYAKLIISNARQVERELAH